MTVTSPKFVVKIPEENITKKIEHSAKQCADMEFREILCPYCGTPLVTVTASMREGILIAKCQKCKAATPLNLAYFYASKTYRRPPVYSAELDGN